MNMKRIGSIVMIALVLIGCQEPTQPTDLTSTRTMTVEVKESEGRPIQDATIVWERFTGLNAPVNGVGRTGEDGFARLTMSDISTSRDSVRLTIAPPDVAPYQGMEPIQVMTSVCSDTLISLSFQPLIQCGTLNASDTVTMTACPDVGDGSMRVCRYYPTDCPPGLIYTSTDTVSGEISIIPQATGTNTSSLEICATFRPTSTTTIVREFRTTVEGREPTSGQVQIRVAVTVLATVDCSECPCPTGKTGSYRTGSACVDQATDFDIPMDQIFQPFQAGSDCAIELVLRSVSNGNQVEVTSGNSITVRGGQEIPDISVRVTGRQVGDLPSTIVYGIRVRNLSNGQVTDCSETLQLDLTTPIVTSNCRIEPQTTDTLEKCVFNDSSTVDTVYLVNDGDCDATFNVGVSNTYFGSTPSGDVVVPAQSRIPVIVFMRVNKAQWDANPQAPYGTNGAKDFTGTLVIRGCDNEDIPLRGVGFVNCSAFKYQCLREFRPSNFPDTYAESIQLLQDKTNIIYQNDNQTFRRYDIWFESITDLGGGNYEFAVGSGDPDNNYTAGRFIRIAQGFQVLPGQSICDTYPAAAAQACQDSKFNPLAGSSVLGGLRAGDVILFIKNDSQCALLWVQEISPDRVGPNALLKVCIEICYPMFTLP